MLHSSKRPRSTLNESTPEHEPQSEGSRADRDVGMNAKRVRWNSPSGLQDEHDSSNSDSSGLAKICLSIFSQHGRIGCAYHDPVKCVVYVLEDTQEGTHYDLTKMILEHSDPAFILTSSKADDSFISVLQNHAEASGAIFQIRPHKEFVPSKGRNRLLSLNLLARLDCDLTSNHEDTSDISSVSRIGNAYDFMARRREVTGDPAMERWNAAIRLANFASLESAPLCISSVGALLDFLTRERATGELGDVDESMESDICGIEALALDQVMHVNADTLCSLQVFESENHATIHSDQTKEGLSLFGILNTTRTALGRSLLRTWFMRPSLSLQVLQARHDAIECFICAENLPVFGALQTQLRGIANIPKTLGLLRSGKGKFSDWQAIVKFTYHSAMIRDALAELHLGRHVDIVVRLIEVLDVTSFNEVGNMVNDIIDWEESAEAARVCVRPHIDEELDKRKHIYRGIDSVLSKVAEQISQTVPVDYAESLNVVYFPQLGFLITVPMRQEWETETGIEVWMDGVSSFFILLISSIASITRRFHVYFKSKEMQDMDNHIGDLHPAIVDREIEIVQELLDKVLQFGQAMEDACTVCAELDCLLSFAEAARAFNYRRPQMVEDPVVDIVQGRHPLQEQILDTFVPNDARLVGGVGFGMCYEDGSSDMGVEATWSSVVLCTGANACGKSVYLKQIALIQYMAQIGSFVPAESATLGVVDKIFTRIHTRESVSKIQSAFMIDLNQVSFALRNCTSKSLILLDEFGKGTVATDGAGLFCGVLNHLLNRGRDCPKVLVASHFHEVFRKDLLDPHKLPITFVHMQVLFASSTGDVLNADGVGGSDSGEESISRVPKPGEKIMYLYRVAPGLSLSSHAAQCAAMFGLPRRVVARAQYVSELLAKHELGKLLEENMTDEELLDLQAAEEVARRFLEWDLTSDEAIYQTGVKARLAEVLGRDPDG
ncbi:muts domain V-domain-containing protein [Boletus reticuloceps]|uniref:Muts domain V-domain-containing protein n=1 Tax=Boletus reticuloceps TaxID=495285 RepID=A0A8I3ABA3_9AGAM|nr:muts domain V-domain-containing protein [Boletus reticuloceps]